MSLASQPGERSDAIEVYLDRPGEGALARAFTPARGDDAAPVLQRAVSGALRGGLTTWVHVGMLVRRMRGRSDPMQGLGHRDTFLALCRLAQAAVEGTPVEGYPSGGTGAHVRVFTTPYAVDDALARLQRVLQPYAAAGTVTRTGRAVIGWFAIRHLIAVRSGAYSLQVVHFTPDAGAPCQVSLMLPRAEGEADGPAPSAPLSRRARRRARRAVPAEPTASGPDGDPAAAAMPAAAFPDARGEGKGPVSSGTAAGAPGPAGVGRTLQLQAYLDAYREHLTRELLLEPFTGAGPMAGFDWTPEPTGDHGVAVGGTVPAAIPDQVVLRMAAQAVAQLGERSQEYAGSPVGDPEPDGDLLVQRWALGAGREHVLSVAARSGDRRRPTQVLIHLAAAEEVAGHRGVLEGAAELEVPYVVPTSGPAVDTAREYLSLPLWWHSANARCDGNDVILYEMPFRGQRLRIRANDYPAEPMYTLLVGDPGAETAALDLEDWPAPWTRPRA